MAHVVTQISAWKHVLLVFRGESEIIYRLIKLVLAQKNNNCTLDGFFFLGGGGGFHLWWAGVTEMASWKTYLVDIFIVYNMEYNGAHLEPNITVYIIEYNTVLVRYIGVHYILSSCKQPLLQVFQPVEGFVVLTDRASPNTALSEDPLPWIK